MVKQTTQKRNIPMCLAALLLCLTMVSLYLVSGLFAKYTTESDSNDSARVAAFYVTSEGTATQTLLIQNMKPGEERTYELKVKNQSETDVHLKWQIESTQNLPIIYQIGDQSWTNDVVYTTDIPIGAAEQTVELKVVWPLAQDDYKLSYEVEQVTVTLTFSQID